MRVRAAQVLSEGLPSPADRAALIRPVQRAWLACDAPQLHAVSSRIDAGLVAAGLGVPLENLAGALGENPDVVRAEPDAEALQNRLLPVGRVLAVLARFGPDHGPRWLRRPHAELGGQLPLDLVLRGSAEQVALLLETAVSGGD